MWIVASIVVALSAAPSPPQAQPQAVDLRYRSEEALGRYLNARLLEERYLKKSGE